MKLRITDSGKQEVFVFGRWCGSDDLDDSEKEIIAQGKGSDADDLRQFFGL